MISRTNRAHEPTAHRQHERSAIRLNAPQDTQKASTRVITPAATLSYPHLFEATTGPGGEGKPKFSATLVFAPGTDITALKQAAIAAARAKFGDKTEALIRAGKIAMPFREDAEDKGYPEGSVYINCRSDQSPGLVSRYKGPDNKPSIITKDMQKPGDPNELYPGCQVRASVVAFGYDFQGMKKGVSFALNNVQKLGDGTRLDNRRAASDEFEADLSEAPASLEDLLGATK